MDKNKNTIEHCCGTVECSDLDQEYRLRLRDITLHLQDNQLICDYTKASVMEHMAHLFSVCAAGLRMKKIKKGDLESLHEHALVLLPQKVLEDFYEWRKENGG